MTAVPPLGVRAANPGNIKLSPIAWRGKKWAAQLANSAVPQFETFEHPLYGIRAMARILMGYQVRSRLGTIRELLARWAPPSENDASRYAANVSAWLSMPADAYYDLTSEPALAALIQAMIRQEVGLRPDGRPWYTVLTIREGCALAALKET